MLGGFGRSGEQPGFALVLEPITFSIDADDGRVVKDAIEHRRGDQFFVDPQRMLVATR